VSTDDEKDDVRARLVEAAIRLLAESGPEALQARKVAAEIGASTMAVYTHFGGMGELIDAVGREGFRRLSASLGALSPSDDTVADIFTMALAYRKTALENPNLYAVTFGLSAPGGRRVPLRDITAPPPEGTYSEGLNAFSFLLDATSRAIDAGRFSPADPLVAAAQLWSAVHGYVTLEISGHFGQAGVEHVLRPLSVTIALGLGDTIEETTRSLRVSTRDWRQAGGNAGARSGD
jgi:AcrR family transcriptional regulator